ncbi:MAG TPA: GPW/gp25 family protein [Jatrophihabitans sp.]|uniref:GPW/gp25 family protein n=1 Tax=Jatrophihabitans sp. TaxID=1932789 RepID=UPI002F1FAB64
MTIRHDIRHDYAYPLRIDAGARQLARANYPEHVNQLLRQLLLTSPGERVCLPEFGCGLRRLVFAPQSDALTATVRIQVQQSINRWLGDQVRLTDVQVLSGANPANGLDEGSLLITVSYTLVDTQTPATLSVKVS